MGPAAYWHARAGTREQPPAVRAEAPAAQVAAAPRPIQTAPVRPKPQFFGGTVTQLDSSRITISRTPPGKSTERRTFLITAKTKISKAVRIRSRVTVRYQHLPDGDFAIEVRLLPLMRVPRAS